MAAQLYGFDLETFLFVPGLITPQIVCGSWADAKQEWIGDEHQAIEFFVETLERGDHLGGVNLAFDIVCVAAARPDLLPLIFRAGDAGLFHCASIREALHDIARGTLFVDPKTGKSFAKRDPETGEMSGRYSMAILMDRHFGIDISGEKTGDVWRYKYAQLHGKPISTWPKEAVDYPLSDARRSYDLIVAQKTHRNKHDEPAQVRAAIALQLLSAWGFRTDGEYLAALESEVDAQWNAAREEFTRHGIYRPNGTKDTKRLAELVTAAYQGQPPRTPTGAVSCDRDTLTESGDPLLEKLGTSGKNDKRKTLYVPFLKRGTSQPINPQYNVLVETGRVSSDCQQLPQRGGVRESIVARPGYVIGSLDYAGLELRTMAKRAMLEVGFSLMGQFLNDGTDVHNYVAAGFLGLSLEEFAARKTELKPYRDVAKMFNFGAGGGAGGAAIAYNAKVKDNIRLCLSLKRATKCGERKERVFVRGQQKSVCALCIEIARELKSKWERAMAEQAQLFAKASRLTANGQKVDVTVFGSNRVRGNCGYTQWLNTPFQGAGGDGMKRALWEIDRECYLNRHSPLWGSRPNLQVHDELLIEFPEDRAHEAALQAAEIMVREMDAITDPIRNEVVPALMRRVFKAARNVYDSRKRLRPYWPPDDGKPWTWPADQARMQADLAA